MAIQKDEKPREAAHNAAASWQLQAAKARLSEVVRRALTEGPQVITKQGREEVVVLSIAQYRKMVARAKQSKSLVNFFAGSPLAKAGLDLERKPDYGRPVDF